jgi:uncharacterized PurR-regulated membrane protein YhhQ (DUF165 family)
MSRTRTYLALATGIYLIVVVLANYLTEQYGMVWVAPELEVLAGTYAAGAALVARDFVQQAATRRWGRAWGALFSVAVVLAAGALTWVLVDPALAVASTVAFLGAELIDLAIFTGVRDRLGFTPAVILSSLIAAPIDTVLFLQLAGFPVTWESILGQFIGKFVWATLVPVAVLYVINARRDRPPATLYDAIRRDLGQ